MITYYTAVTVLCLLSLGALSLLVWENNRMPKQDKRLLYLTYALMALSTLVEWIGGWSDGRTDLPAWAMPTIKCVEFIVKPLAGGALVAQMRVHNRWLTALMGVLAANVLLQIVAALNGWMVTVDSQGHYSPGILYPAYLTACIDVVVLVTIEYVYYGRGFSKQNRLSLAVVMVFVLVGIAMQALLPMRPQSVSVALAMAASLMYIRSMEFSSLQMDERLASQREQIDTDALTGVLSRYAYARALDELNAAEAPPPSLTAFVVDINGLKRVNDTLGHDAGDELITAAAHCLEMAFRKEDRIFRTGGDEFVVLAHMSREDTEKATARLDDEMRRWHGKYVYGITMSVGHACAADCVGASAEALVHEADLAMYDAKATYYKSVGRRRRRKRR